MESTGLLSRRGMTFAALALGCAAVSARAETNDDPWPSLSAQIFKGRPIQDGSARLSVDTPYRAEDAALVPLSIVLAPVGVPSIRALTVVIDENPSPVAGRFVIGGSSALRALSTRVRVDSYTNIHVVAETEDGGLYAVQRFVKAAGGCSAPAAKQQADAIPVGTMRFRQFPLRPDADTREVELMIRHPNYSGMQMDQVSRLYVPAHFVAAVRVWQGNDLVLGVDSGISISENPAFRFDVRPNGSAEFRAEVTDSEGAVFRQSWPAVHA